MALKLVSNSIPKVTGKTFARKYIALGRIIHYWDDIIGQQWSQKAQPIKIHYHKYRDKKKKPDACLEIATSSANASVLIMQKDIILERINQVFGDRWITDIRFAHISKDHTPETSKKNKNKQKISIEDKNKLHGILETIDDPDIKERLKSFGQSFFKGQ